MFVVRTNMVILMQIKPMLNFCSHRFSYTRLRFRSILFENDPPWASQNMTGCFHPKPLESRTSQGHLFWYEPSGTNCWSYSIILQILLGCKSSHHTLSHHYKRRARLGPALHLWNTGLWKSLGNIQASFLATCILNWAYKSVASYNLDYVNVIWCHCKRHHHPMLSRTLFYLRDPPNTSFPRGSLCPQALRQTLWRGYLSHWVYHLTQHQNPTWCPCKEPRSLHPYLHMCGIIEPKPCELSIEVILSIKFANV